MASIILTEYGNELYKQLKRLRNEQSTTFAMLANERGLIKTNVEEYDKLMEEVVEAYRGILDYVRDKILEDAANQIECNDGVIEGATE